MILAAATVVGLLCAGVLLGLQAVLFERERRTLREEIATERERFATERKEWVAERRDLNNRIQIPEAAPFMSEPDAAPSNDDLPLLPEFEMDEAELEKARKELAAAGYEEGPAG